MPAMTEPRRRGRPPGAHSELTRERLLDAALGACADRGFDGATLQEIGRRAGVTPAAVYNHFESREALLHEAGVRGLQQMTDAVGDAERPGAGVLERFALAYLHPDTAPVRRLLAELHLAGRRDPVLAELLAGWHRAGVEEVTSRLGGDDRDLPRIKALFLLLLGICHLDDLPSISAGAGPLTDRVLAMARALEA